MQWWEVDLGDIEKQDNSSRRLVLIIYDIVKDKRRNKINKFLEGYGKRIQKSAFECFLNEGMYKKVTDKLAKMIDEKEDLLRVYRFSHRCEIRCWGSVGKSEDEQYWVL